MASNNSSPSEPSSNEPSSDNSSSSSKLAEGQAAEDKSSSGESLSIGDVSLGTTTDEGSSTDSSPKEPQHPPRRNRTIMNLIYDTPASNRPTVDPWVEFGEDHTDRRPRKTAEQQLAQALESVIPPREDSDDPSQESQQSTSNSDAESDTSGETGDDSVSG
ncbi:hypothetical protein F5Y12DRAFT_134434 [Xylaria sp. FL1777]|nr:hypothetical protein F5Y12DRAFT_134434 [Xylaria sp. FL1777]